MVPIDNKTSFQKMKTYIETYNSDSSVESVEEELDYEVKNSRANCNLSLITSFIYGGLSSRFWMLRKHFCSLNFQAGAELNLPFYNWQCLTLQTKTRDIDLVIDSEQHLKIMIEFLLYELNTADSLRDTANIVSDGLINEMKEKNAKNKEILE